MSDVGGFLSISLKTEGSCELFFSDFRVGIGLCFSGISDALQSYVHMQELIAVI